MADGLPRQSPLAHLGLDARAAAPTADALVRGGVQRARLRVVGYGETRPTADNGTADGRAQNRRVELNMQ